MDSLRVDTLHGNITSDKQVNATSDVQRLTSVYELTCRAPPSLLLICDRVSFRSRFIDKQKAAYCMFHILGHIFILQEIQ
jgi:hypothetical protein